MSKTVNVMCDMPLGLTIRTFEEYKGEMGQPLIRPTGKQIALKAGSNPGIDKEFAELWLEQNAKSDLVLENRITIADEDEQPETPATET